MDVLSLNLLIAISGLGGFLATVLMTPRIITVLKNIDVVGRDIHKKDKPQVAELGGFPVLLGFLTGILAYVGTLTFYLKINGEVISQILAATLTIMIITLLGMLDDLTTLLAKRKIGGKINSEKKVGFKQSTKFLLPLFAAVPLMVVNSGVSSIAIPFLGNIDLGILYPLLIVPLGIFGAANATNMLAGMNGLTAGLGTILISALGGFALLNGELVAAAIAFIFVAVLLGFLIYNWYPAKIFPGDSLDYTIGAVAASVAILGNIERFAVIAFIPWFVEFLLKARNWFKAETYGVLQSDGTLQAPYSKIYSLTHVVMRSGRFTEKQLVLILLGVEVFFVFLAFALYH
ncbi:Phospho-N-acetylmuramoyl-pentapeptide-transferase [uncultured archaeon]|nr:Phospho-N-acetylmuramoyl-pentapeptide-transferase [uncultured archaeon]